MPIPNDRSLPYIQYFPFFMNIKAYRSRTDETFAKLQSGQLKFRQMSTSQLKSYLTGIAMFKQEEYDHFKTVQHEFRLRTMPDTLKIKQKGGKSAALKKKDEPSLSRPISYKEKGATFKDWISSIIPCLRSPKSDIEMKLLTHSQRPG